MKKNSPSKKPRTDAAAAAGEGTTVEALTSIVDRGAAENLDLRDSDAEAPEASAAKPLDLLSSAPDAVGAHAKDHEQVAVPPPPGGNRARFLAGIQPTKVSCDLTNVAATPGLRFSFEAIVTVVYPASASPPERRYIELADAQGFTGITVWNSYAHAITAECVGRVIKFTRLSIAVHNGKKSLTMSKESTMHVENATYENLLSNWWRGLLTQPILNALQFHDSTEGIVNVSGVLGLIQVEEKMVKGVPKLLLVLHLTDASGRLEIRSWNHSDTEFLQFREQPVLLKRVRVVTYAGQKVGELLGGDTGTTVTSEFDSKDLRTYWQQ
jgi:hypothetical protein